MSLGTLQLSWGRGRQQQPLVCRENLLLLAQFLRQSGRRALIVRGGGDDWAGSARA